MSGMAELCKSDGTVVVVGRVPVILERYKRMTPLAKGKHYIRCDGQTYAGMDVLKLPRE